MSVLKSTWHIPLFLHFVQLRCSALYSTVTLLICILRYFPNHSPNLSSFSRCMNCFSTLGFRLLVIQVTLYAKALPSQHIATTSQNLTSSSSDGGKVMQSMFTLTNIRNLTIFKESSISTPNSSLLPYTKLSGFNSHALHSLHLRLTLRKRRLACRDLQRDIAHSTCCDFINRGFVIKITTSPLSMAAVNCR